METRMASTIPDLRPAVPRALLDVDIAPVESVLFHGETMCIVDYDSDPAHPHFAGHGPLRVPCIGFPRRQTEIHVEGHEPFVSDASCMVFFDRGTVYRRRRICPLGERATVVNLRPDLLQEVLESAGAVRGGRVLAGVCGRLEPALHEKSVALANRLASGVPFEPVAAEEAALELVVGAFRANTGAWRKAPGEGRRAASSQLEMVAFVKQHIRENIGQKTSLSELAGLLGVSPFYLCRFFRAATGQTVHQYQLQIRLAAALDMLPEYQGNLATLAVDLGFSSHSHLTTLFKRAYGYSPGSSRQFRRAQGLPVGHDLI